jgi:hypothetical protein
MKSSVKLFLVSAILSIAMFTTCKDDKGADSSSLKLDKKTVDVLAMGGITLINVSTDREWTASVDVDWVKISPASGSGSGLVNVTIDPRVSGARRSAFVTFESGASIEKVEIQQRGNLVSDYYTTGEVIRLHRSTRTNPGEQGIAIVFIGDGFDREDCRKGGFYESHCRRLADLFLSMPVVRDFKDYFDIYARVDISRERGVRNCVDRPELCPDNVYGSGHPEINFNKAYENAKLTAGKEQFWYIFIGNGMIGGYAMGNSAIYSTNEVNKPYWMMHEFAGHALGGFPDLYYIQGDGILNEEDKDMFDNNHNIGELLMYDWQKDPAKVYWKDFIGQPGYENVGIYPGGYCYWSRCIKFGECVCCEDIFTDVMYGPTAHYSVMERYQLWQRIQRAAGSTVITFDEFKEYDKVNLLDADYGWDRYDHWQDDRTWAGNSEGDYKWD